MERCCDIILNIERHTTRDTKYSSKIQSRNRNQMYVIICNGFSLNQIIKLKSLGFFFRVLQSRVVFFIIHCVAFILLATKYRHVKCKSWMEIWIFFYLVLRMNNALLCGDIFVSFFLLSLFIKSIMNLR